MPTLLILEDDPDVAQAARLALRKLAAVAVRTAPEALPAALDEVAPGVSAASPLPAPETRPTVELMARLSDRLDRATFHSLFTCSNFIWPFRLL